MEMMWPMYGWRYVDECDLWAALMHAIGSDVDGYYSGIFRFRRGNTLCVRMMGCTCRWMDCVNSNSGSCGAKLIFFMITEKVNVQLFVLLELVLVQTSILRAFYEH